MLPWRPVRPPVDTITAPPFPRDLEWVNVAMLRMDQQRGHPVLIEFWDFCRPNSLRTLPYVKAWHDRYSPEGLRVIGIHTPGFEASRDPAAAREACARLGIAHAVALDHDYAVWRLYENRGWPARYLFDAQGVLVDYHYGEGAYAETERAICEQLGIEREPLAPLRPEDDPDARVLPQTADQEGAWSGPYEAGGVWAVLDGHGVVTANGIEVAVDHPGAYELISHERHAAGVLELVVGDGVRCDAVCFTPGLA